MIPITSWTTKIGTRTARAEAARPTRRPPSSRPTRPHMTSVTSPDSVDVRRTAVHGPALRYMSTMSTQMKRGSFAFDSEMKRSPGFSRPRIAQCAYSASS
jgi:hypothetical protein